MKSQSEMKSIRASFVNTFSTSKAPLVLEQFSCFHDVRMMD